MINLVKYLYYYNYKNYFNENVSFLHKFNDYAVCNRKIVASPYMKVVHQANISYQQKSESENVCSVVLTCNMIIR